MRETVKQRRQLLEFSQWVERDTNEKLMLGVTSPMIPQMLRKTSNRVD